MKWRPTLLSCLTSAALLGTAGLAAAESAVKIGMITTLSTGAGYLGQDVRDGFMLAVAEEDGKLGGVPVEVIVEDDGLKPEIGKQLADRFLEQEEVEIVTGLIFSNVAPVVAPLALKAGAFYISPNAAPSTFAGSACHENYFVVSWQNDSLHESAGIYANKLGYGKAYILAPNYQAGKDALAGFKRYFEGEIVEETYTKLDQTDYAAEIAKIRAAAPEMVFYFLPGGMGINFLKQYAQSGLNADIPVVVSSVSMDAAILKAVGDVALGVRSTSHWNHDLDNAANKAFVENYVATYNRTPTVYSSQGYDTARLIASALKATGGKVKEDMDGFREALRAANFESVRGEFKFDNNHHPVNDWVGRVVEQSEDGGFHNRTVEMVAEDLRDAYAADCPMQ